jgi:hypothetical protein
LAFSLGGHQKWAYNAQDAGFLFFSLPASRQHTQETTTHAGQRVEIGRTRKKERNKKKWFPRRNKKIHDSNEYIKQNSSFSSTNEEVVGIPSACGGIKFRAVHFETAVEVSQHGITQEEIRRGEIINLKKKKTTTTTQERSLKNK